MRRTLVSLAFLAGGLPLGAQGLADGFGILGPQFVSYAFGSGVGARTVTELAVPFAVILPLSERFSIDISSAYANAEVMTKGASMSSSISGLTDTQVRGNLTLGDNAAVFTIGLNLPTGKYSVPQPQQDAAGQIGSSFLVYPVSSMGTGLGATGGIAFAWPAGNWNVGVGGSFRHSTQFDAYEVSTQKLRFQPGDEFRLRAGLNRPVGDGRFSLAATYSKFGNDAVNDSTFGTGDRALAQTSLYLPMRGGDVTISLWNLYRAAAQLADSALTPTPWENVMNLNLALGYGAGSVYMQPSAEARVWQRDGTKAGCWATLAFGSASTSAR